MHCAKCKNPIDESNLLYRAYCQGYYQCSKCGYMNVHPPRCVVCNELILVGERRYISKDKDVQVHVGCWNAGKVREEMERIDEVERLRNYSDD